MNTTERRTIVCLLACAIAASVPPCSGASVFENPHALSVELRRLESSIREGHRQQVYDALLLAWVVTSDRRDYPIRTDELKSALESKDDTASEAWLEQAAAQLEIWQDGKTAGDPRAELDRILARKEFASVRPPSPWERVKEWLQNQLGNLLARLFGYLGPSTGRFIWGLAAVAVIFLAFWLYRTLRKGTKSSLSLISSQAHP